MALIAETVSTDFTSTITASASRDDGGIDRCRETSLLNCPVSCFESQALVT